jgi:hypothetical protein
MIYGQAAMYIQVPKEITRQAADMLLVLAKVFNSYSKIHGMISQQSYTILPLSSLNQLVGTFKIDNSTYIQFKNPLFSQPADLLDIKVYFNGDEEESEHSNPEMYHTHSVGITIPF